MASTDSTPSFEPLWRRWPADLDTPLSTWLKVGHGRPYGVLLESVEGGEQVGRWSFVASDPLWVLTVRGASAWIDHRDGRRENLEGDPFELLRQRLEPYSSSAIPGLPPVGQLFGFWGYELIHWVEPSVPVHPRGENDLPDGCWMFCDALLVFDQVRRQVTAVAYADHSGGGDPRCPRRGGSAADALKAAASTTPQRPHPIALAGGSAESLPMRSNTTQAAFEQPCGRPANTSVLVMCSSWC